MKGLMPNMNRFYSKTNYHINQIIKTIRRIYYGEDIPAAVFSVKNITVFGRAVVFIGGKSFLRKNQPKQICSIFCSSLR